MSKVGQVFFVQGINTDDLLVRGAKLACSKSHSRNDHTLLMENNEETNNALLSGEQVFANRKNREEKKDITPFKKCSGGDRCTNRIQTAGKWENLTISFNEVNIPHINFIPLVSWNKVKNLNQKSDELLFRANYAEELRYNVGNYRFNDKEMRRNANLRIYTDRNAADDACITLKSILLCEGCGGIIYPITSGQERSIFGHQCAEILSRKSADISNGDYDNIAKCILENMLTSTDIVTLLRLCFMQYDTCEGSYSNVIYQYHIDQIKIDGLLDSMRKYIKENGLKYDRDVMNRYYLFEGVRFIREPAGGMLEAGPHFELEYKTDDFERYVLYYERMHIVALGDRHWYEHTSYNMTTYRPVNRHKGEKEVVINEISNLHARLTNDIVDGIGRIVVPGIKTATISTATAFAMDIGQTARWTGTGSNLLLSMIDVSDDVAQYKEFTKWKDGYVKWEDCTYLAETIDLNLSVTTFSDSEVASVYRISENEYTNDRISELNSLSKLKDNGLYIDEYYIFRLYCDHDEVLKFINILQ